MSQSSSDVWDGRTTLLDRVIDPTSRTTVDFGHYLVVVEGAELGRRIEITDAAISIGRVAPADVVFPDHEVSRKHCTFELNLGDVVLTDLDSTNGTFVDGKLIKGATSLPVGAMIQVGRQLLKYERRSRKEVRAADELDRDLDRANRYVQSLLPPPIASGPITTEWVYMPSARLGGDVFGYHTVDANRFALYLVDVSGHGAEAAMHAVSIMNVLRQRALRGIDFERPAEVVSGLNAMFPMEDHASMFFTIWYGIFDASRRVIDYCSAGHHPAYLRPGTSAALEPLRCANLAAGVMTDSIFTPGQASVPAGATIYLFSDGVFEVVTASGKRWELDDFIPLLEDSPLPGVSEPQRLLSKVRAVARSASFEDDFSLVTVTFA